MARRANSLRQWIGTGKLPLGTDGTLMQQIMTEQRKPARKAQPRPPAPMPKPDWADGLRNIYDTVVNEPLPADMLALLASLDAADEGEDQKPGVADATDGSASGGR
jgi:hypothetical protein